MYDEIICDFNNIYKAYKLAHRGKSDDREVIEFDKNKMYNLHKLQEKLINREWDEIFKYYRFVVTDPKKRTIDALHFEGRIIQHVLCDLILKPYFEPRLVKENAACRVGKGTEYAVSMLKAGLVKYYKKHDDGYVVQIDVHHYFPSVNREKLKEIIDDFSDKEILEFVNWIIDNSPDSGLPIGNQSSQWFALYYMNKLDRVVKEDFDVNVYTRYMDDLVVVVESKDTAHELLKRLRRVAESFNLEFNGKTQVYPLRKGICYLSWKFVKLDRVVKLLNPRKRPKKIQKIKEILEERRWDRYQSMRAYLRMGDTYSFRKKRMGLNFR